jgi:hypothetical protein
MGPTSGCHMLDADFSFNIPLEDVVIYAVDLQVAAFTVRKKKKMSSAAEICQS